MIAEFSFKPDYVFTIGNNTVYMQACQSADFFGLVDCPYIDLAFFPVQAFNQSALATQFGVPIKQITNFTGLTAALQAGPTAWLAMRPTAPVGCSSSARPPYRGSYGARLWLPA